MSKVVGKRNARNDVDPSNKEDEILMKTKRISPTPETLNGGEDMSEEQKFKLAKKILERLDQACKETHQYMAESRDPDIATCCVELLDPIGFRVKVYRRSENDKELERIFARHGRKMPRKK
jgi:hypothetical protein